MSLSLRGRLTIGIAAALSVTLGAILATLRLALGGILEADLDDDLSKDVGLVSARVALLGSLDDRERLQEIVDSYSLGGLASAFLIVIRDDRGNVLASTPGVDTDDLALQPTHWEVVREGDHFNRTVTLEGGDKIRLHTARLTIGREIVGIVQGAEDAGLTSRPLARLPTVLVM